MDRNILLKELAQEDNIDEWSEQCEVQERGEIEKTQTVAVVVQIGVDKHGAD